MAQLEAASTSQWIWPKETKSAQLEVAQDPSLFRGGKINPRYRLHEPGSLGIEKSESIDGSMATDNREVKPRSASCDLGRVRQTVNADANPTDNTTSRRTKSQECLWHWRSPPTMMAGAHK